MNIEDYSNDSKEEFEADKFARENLISKKLWETAPQTRLNIHYIQKIYTNWAREHRINKWLVLGRISHELKIYKFKDDGTRKFL